MAALMHASTLLIEEKTGKKRRLVLRGAGLPLQGASWKSEQRLVTKWYAGARSATQHVLGPFDAPSEWKGVWNTTRLFGAPPSYYSGAGAEEQLIIRANELRDLVDAFARDGALLRVTWATDDDRTLVREGRIGPYDFAHARMDDIEWQITFVWTGRGDDGERTTPTTESLEAAARAAQAALRRVGSVVNGNLGPFTAIEGLLGSALANTIGKYEGLSRQIVHLLEGAAADSAEVAKLIAAALSSTDLANATPYEASLDAGLAASAAVQSATAIGDELGRQPVEAQVPGGRPSQVASAAAYTARVHAAADDAAARALALQGAAARRQSSVAKGGAARDRVAGRSVIATLRPRAGETFASLAQKYYGSPDMAGALARANGVPSYQVAPCPGALVLVPALSGVDTSAPA